MYTLPSPLPSSEPYYELGTFGRPIRTISKDAQEWFNRGLTWTYGFHHEEAVLCFEQSLSHDPRCVITYLFLIYALGPNYNKKGEYFADDELTRHMTKIHQATDDVEELLTAREGDVGGLPNLERMFYEALKGKFPREYRGKEFRKWNEAFVDGMKAVYEEYGEEDLDMSAVYVDSMMCLTPWQLWDLRTGQPTPNSQSLQALSVLEKALTDPRSDTHPGLLHLYIHLIEMSATPEKGIPYADKLFGLIPDSGHLNHMPSHLDILIGDYRRAIASNARAIISDEMYLAKSGSDNFYTTYRIHNYESLIYAAMFNGQFKVAMRYVEQLERSLGEELVRKLPDFNESSVSTRLHVLVRFGRWDEILEMTIPLDQELYCNTTAMTHYARGIAFAARGRMDEAMQERAAFREAFKRVPESRITFPNRSVDVLAVGEAMLDGEIAYRQGDFELAFNHLRESIRRYDSLIYGEPWGWLQPVRHAYAALQLERGNLNEALKTYAADLGYDDSLPRAHQHPNNVWALHGYYECLTRLGKDDQAKIVLPQLRLALAVADVKISSSCFCRLETQEGLADGAAGATLSGTGEASCCI
jgi:tetratricopeptide (TPR) repeat protein